MDNVANLSDRQRQELFGQTAANRGFHPAIAEKDFWVCWVLMKLFGSEELTKQLVFKGGTSLSKAHHLIQRFSEDIDLVLNWQLLGYGPGGDDAWREIPSNTQLDRLRNGKSITCLSRSGWGSESRFSRTPGLFHRATY